MDNNLGQVVLVKDIRPDALSDYYFGNSYYPNFLTEFNDRLYFVVEDGENGNELWVSDGTNGGTQLLVDIYPGFFGSYPGKFTSFIEFNNKLYFSDRKSVV